MTSHVSKWRTSACVTRESNCERQFLFFLILYSHTFSYTSETAGAQPGRSEPWWSAACAQSRPCTACWAIRWSVAWDSHSVQQPPVSRQKQKRAATLHHHKNHRHRQHHHRHHHHHVTGFSLFSSQIDTSFSLAQTVHFWVTRGFKRQTCSPSGM